MICALKERAVSSAATYIGISRTHDPWTPSQPKRRCLAYGLLRACERKNEVNKLLSTGPIIGNKKLRQGRIVYF